MIQKILGGLVITVAFIGVLCLGEASGNINFTSNDVKKEVYFDGMDCHHVTKDGVEVDDGCKDINHATDEYIPVQMDEEWARKDYAFRQERDEF